MHGVDIMADILGGGTDSDLHRSMAIINDHGAGVIVILREPNPYSLSQRLIQSENTSEQKAPILRNYGIGAQILLDLGVQHMTLLSNSQKNIAGLEGYNLHIHGQKPIQ
jgi:3,4-dihydroxy 2-butanone 4-phosphate synthase/GTP cyclohydrolase II